MSVRKQREQELVLDIIAGEDGREIVPAVMDEEKLARAAHREARGMVRSLAHEIAKAEGQARLDACRAEQALRVGQATQRPTAQAMAEVAEQGRRMAEAHPGVEAEIEEMTKELVDLFRQMPRVAMLAYSSRYFDTRRNRRGRLGDC